MSRIVKNDLHGSRCIVSNQRSFLQKICGIVALPVFILLMLLWHMLVKRRVAFGLRTLMKSDAGTPRVNFNGVDVLYYGNFLAHILIGDAVLVLVNYYMIVTCELNHLAVAVWGKRKTA